MRLQPLQAMMGLPTVLLFIMALGFGATLVLIIVIRQISGRTYPKPKYLGIKDFLFAIAGALMFGVWFIYKLWTFEGPWIN